MNAKEKIRCYAIAKKIKSGAYGEWNENTKEEILNTVKEEYSTTQEMLDYIEVLMNENTPS